MVHFVRFCYILCLVSVSAPFVLLLLDDATEPRCKLCRKKTMHSISRYSFQTTGEFDFNTFSFLSGCQTLLPVVLSFQYHNDLDPTRHRRPTAGAHMFAIARYVGNPMISLSYILWNISVSGKCALMVDMVGPCDDQNDDDQDSNPPRLGRAPLLPTPRIRQPSLTHLHRHGTDLRQLQQLPMPVFRLRRR